MGVRGELKRNSGLTARLEGVMGTVKEEGWHLPIIGGAPERYITLADLYTVLRGIEKQAGERTAHDASKDLQDQIRAVADLINGNDGISLGDIGEFASGIVDVGTFLASTADVAVDIAGETADLVAEGALGGLQLLTLQLIAAQNALIVRELAYTNSRLKHIRRLLQ